MVQHNGLDSAGINYLGQIIPLLPQGSGNTCRMVPSLNHDPPRRNHADSYPQTRAPPSGGRFRPARIRPAGDLNPNGAGLRECPIHQVGDESPNGPYKPGLCDRLPKPGCVHHRFNVRSHDHPHFHPNDRFATVIGTCMLHGQVRSDGTTPMPPAPSSHTTATQIHYDGAKDQEVVTCRSWVRDPKPPHDASRSKPKCGSHGSLEVRRSSSAQVMDLR